MPEPITLALVGGAVLTEGIKFLYGQATEALKRRRDHKEAETKSATVPAPGEIPDIFAGDVKPLEIHLDKVAELEPQLIEARKSLADYADDLAPVTTDNTALLQQTDALRRLMEIVFQYQLTFQGEPGAASGPKAYGKADVESVKGLVAGLSIGTMVSGTAHGEVKAKTVEAGGQAYGVKIDRLG